MCNTTTLGLLLFALCLFALLISEVRRRKLRASKRTGNSSADANCQISTKTPVFLIKPYLQLGTAPGVVDGERLEIHWFASTADCDSWTLEVRRGGALRRWLASRLQTPTQSKVSFVEQPGARPVESTHFSCVVQGLRSGEKFDYRVLKNGTEVFSSHATARKDASQPYRFVAVGDMGEARIEQMKVAHQIDLVAPDFIAMPGDLAYKRGRVSEYVTNYFPQMNADYSAPHLGAPLLRSILHFACLGNHDYARPDVSEEPNIDEFPDSFGYFIFWSLPMNGPSDALSDVICQKIVGQPANRDRFLQAAQGRYPRMAAFSYDYGNSHWLILDSNVHVDWTNQELQEWVRQDLSSSKATWKFVMFHHPLFTTHAKHGKEQRMRLMTRTFEECGVDIVFNGHAHIYERTYPLTFAVKPKADGSSIGLDGSVDGTWTLDRKFDGLSVTKPEGVIYVVTGAGGAKLQEWHLPPSNGGAWMETTAKHVSDLHSFTVCDVDGERLTLRQISLEGDELERLVITK